MTNPSKPSPESPAKEQPGEQNAAPQVPDEAERRADSHPEVVPAVAAPDVAAMVKKLRAVSEMRVARVDDICYIAAKAAALIQKLGQGWIPPKEK